MQSVEGLLTSIFDWPTPDLWKKPFIVSDQDLDETSAVLRLRNGQFLADLDETTYVADTKGYVDAI